MTPFEAGRGTRAARAEPVERVVVSVVCFAHSGVSYAQCDAAADTEAVDAAACEVW